MRAKQIFEYALVELNKREAPSLLLEDYNYFINKAINQFVNKSYNIYDINQQKSDDLRVLKSSSVLIPIVSDDWASSNLFDKTYEVDLPDDYFHTLNCIVEYDVKKNYKCYNQGSQWQVGAKRATADMLSQILHNYYMRPSYKNPYYYINNINVNNDFPTSDNLVEVQPSKYIITVVSADVTTSSKILIVDVDNNIFEVTADANDTATLLKGKINALSTVNNDIAGPTTPTTAVEIETIKISSVTVFGPGLSLSVTPNATNAAKTRYGNTSKVRMEIRYGKDNSTFELKKVYIDYLKVPQFIRLTQEQVDEVEDTSQILEFPDYVCQEIVNELIKLLLENSSDPRVQSQPIVSQSIANPAQQQQPQQRR